MKSNFFYLVLPSCRFLESFSHTLRLLEFSWIVILLSWSILKIFTHTELWLEFSWIFFLFSWSIKKIFTHTLHWLQSSFYSLEVFKKYLLTLNDHLNFLESFFYSVTRNFFFEEKYFNSKYFKDIDSHSTLTWILLTTAGGTSLEAMHW